MKTCIVGAGAIGGLLAARLAAAGCETTVVERGERLEAIREQGLRLRSPDGSELRVRPRAVATPAEAGRHDLVILAVKSYQIAEVASGLREALAPEGVVLPVQNGVPWWYFQRCAGEHAGRALESVDPGGAIAALIPSERVLGAVAFPAAEVKAAGVVELVEGNRFTLGELDGAVTGRAEAVARLLISAGFKAPVATDIRAEVWTKLLGNLSFNPVSALTGATMAGICRHPQARALILDMMQEAWAVAEALGVRMRVSIEKRMAGAEAVGEHRTSMLQDVLAGSRTEVDALLGAVVELGRLAGVATPAMSAVYACARLLDDTRPCS